MLSDEGDPLLVDLFQRLQKAYGQLAWWPADSSFEMALGAILTQNTSWTNVEKAIEELKGSDLLSAKALSEAPLEELEQKIKSSGYFRQKAKRIKNFSTHVVEDLEGSLENLANDSVYSAREFLLSISGIGPETADSILLYALKFPIFVVDTYTGRLLSRVLRRDPQSWTYEELQSYFMDRLPDRVDLFNEFHALIVQHGKETCKSRKPHCQSCCLLEICEEGPIILSKQPLSS